MWLSKPSQILNCLPSFTPLLDTGSKFQEVHVKFMVPWWWGQFNINTDVAYHMYVKKIQNGAFDIFEIYQTKHYHVPAYCCLSLCLSKHADNFTYLVLKFWTWSNLYSPFLYGTSNKKSRTTTTTTNNNTWYQIYSK